MGLIQDTAINLRVKYQKAAVLEKKPSTSPYC